MFVLGSIYLSELSDLFDFDLSLMFVMDLPLETAEPNDLLLLFLFIKLLTDPLNPLFAFRDPVTAPSRRIRFYPLILP